MATATYCSVNDVERILGMKPETFEEDQGNLTIDDITELIEMAEDEINAETNSSWKASQVINEFYDLPYWWRRDGSGIHGGHSIFSMMKVYLTHRNIRTLSSGDGDKLEVWNGSSYDDWITTKTEGRNDDFWIDYEQGIIYFVSTYPMLYTGQELRLTYRWGYDIVPGDIKKATARRVAADMFYSDDSSNYVASGDRSIALERRIEMWRDDWDRIKMKYWESETLNPRRIR